MATVGQVIEGPNGVRAEVTSTGASSGGRAFEVEWVYPAGYGNRAGAHLHSRQSESFEVLAGRVRYVLDGRKRGPDRASRSSFRPHSPVAHRQTPLRWRDALETASVADPLLGQPPNGGADAVCRLAIETAQVRDSWTRPDDSLRHASSWRVQVLFADDILTRERIACVSRGAPLVVRLGLVVDRRGEQPTSQRVSAVDPQGFQHPFGVVQLALGELLDQAVQPFLRGALLARVRCTPARACSAGSAKVYVHTRSHLRSRRGDEADVGAEGQPSRRAARELRYVDVRLRAVAERERRDADLQAQHGSAPPMLRRHRHRAGVRDGTVRRLQVAFKAVARMRSIRGRVRLPYAPARF